MYIPSSNTDRLQAAIVAIVLAIIGQPVFALSTDQQKSIVIEADSGELDDTNNISIYSGNVIVTQGSIRMTGDKMTVYFTDADDMETLIMEGNPATYRQLPDDSEKYDEGEALRMEYYELKNLVILIDKARVTQSGSRFSGNRIEYDTLLNKIRATSKPAGEETPADPADTDNRVRIIIPSKQQ